MEKNVVEEKQHSGLSLTLQVMNGNELESGRAAKCLFSVDGGEIGHGEGCHWSVQDRAGSIAGRACVIVQHDGAFCLRSLIQGLMINLAPISTATGLVQLRQGDEISLGALTLKVYLHEGQRISYDQQMATPESIVSQRAGRIDPLLSTDGQPEYPGMPLRQALSSTVVNSFSSDPLQVLQSESLTTVQQRVLYGQQPVPVPESQLSDGIDTAFMDLPPVYTELRDEDDFTQAEMAQKHLAVTPLMRGLGSSLHITNSQDADAFLEETGRALQAAIKGLLDLQHSQNSLSDKHLRPLEDNPLRLNLDYTSALEVMFAEGKSPVHLAAPAAIGESLRNVCHHEEANRAAIAEALRVMLEAFSPQSLLRRFVQYRRSHELRRDLDDAGAWAMYRHYYAELASDRQQGFAMLFNEVYAQVYDRVLREKQRECEA